MFEEVLNIRLCPQYVITCTVTLGNELFKSINNPCIFRTLFFEIYLVWNKSLHVFERRFIENHIHIQSSHIQSIFKHINVFSKYIKR